MTVAKRDADCDNSFKIRRSLSAQRQHRAGQAKDRGANGTAAEGFSATLPPRDHGRGLRERLQLLRQTLCGNLDFWHPHMTILPGVREFLQICGIGRQFGFPFPPETFWKIRLKSCPELNHAVHWEHEIRKPRPSRKTVCRGGRFTNNKVALHEPVKINMY